MSMYHNKDYPDGSFDFAVTTTLGDDSIAFGTSHILNQTLSYIGNNGDTLSTELWIPVGAPRDTNSLLVLIPGYGEHTYALYPFAISATRAGFPVAFISARGLDYNARLNGDYYFNEVQDISSAVTEYAKDEGIHNLKIGAFGYSLGAVLALDLAYKNDHVRAAALESIVKDPIVSASRVMKGKDYESLMELVKAHPEIRSMSTEEVLQHWDRRKTPLKFIWGETDNVALKPERDSVAVLARASVPNVSIEEIPKAGHIMRYGFPLSPSQAIGLNDSIVNFFVRAMKD